MFACLSVYAVTISYSRLLVVKSNTAYVASLSTHAAAQSIKLPRFAFDNRKVAEVSLGFVRVLCCLFITYSLPYDESGSTLTG